ncbi:auxin-induced protein 6B [Amborella trichopoda]|uniref:Uncharacterized protein n=1 Tax=Amborella trichopoda TaxID=13333 RepID=W1NR36_AMBTC|nr:auxin-induced protein 6B [Amborella trichopoda]ERM99411.1 hypothetical protein AMTR_s00131p00053580 [Amborella trichopoda]|eukprot:XP_006836558.1 auxin-induced protein 6B [Amborella trichopoda]
MPLQRAKLVGALKRWNLKSPRSPRERINWESGMVLPDAVSDFQVGSDDAKEFPTDVHKGFIAVYVGQELRRYVIPVSYLNHSVFMALLQKAEEEFGFTNNGGIKLPCEVAVFEHILWLLKNQ